jgi:hypothetical protein
MGEGNCARSLPLQVDICAENRRLCWVIEGHLREVFGNLTVWGCVFGEEAQSGISRMRQPAEGAWSILYRISRKKSPASRGNIADGTKRRFGFCRKELYFSVNCRSGSPSQRRKQRRNSPQYYSLLTR